MSEQDKKTCAARTATACELDENCHWVVDGVKGYCIQKSCNERPLAKCELDNSCTWVPNVGGKGYCTSIR